MINRWKLQELLFIRKMKMRDLAAGMGLTPSGLSKKVTGKNNFTVKDVLNVQEVLGLTDEERNAVFFCAPVLKDSGQNARSESV